MAAAVFAHPTTCPEALGGLTGWRSIEAEALLPRVFRSCQTTPAPRVGPLGGGVAEPAVRRMTGLRSLLFGEYPCAAAISAANDTSAEGSCPSEARWWTGGRGSLRRRGRGRARGRILRWETSAGWLRLSCRRSRGRRRSVTARRRRTAGSAWPQGPSTCWWAARAGGTRGACSQAADSLRRPYGSDKVVTLVP